MNFNQVKLDLSAIGEPAYRLTQLTAAVKSGAVSWSEIKGWPKSLISHFSQTPFVTYQSVQVLTSIDGTRKAKLVLLDGAQIETVCMTPKPGIVSVCVSSEVGCPMGCAFCATGAMGFKRALTSEEITDQWLFWLKLQTKNHEPAANHLVFMGMGEPFHNQAQVFESIADLHNYYELGWRKISISTCGVIPGITALSKTYPQVNLAISLHSAVAAVRQTLMPISRAYSLDALRQAVSDYLKETGRQIMFEYILLSGVNDQISDRKALIAWVSTLPQSLIHVNLIRFNPVGTIYHEPTKDGVGAWKKALIKAGISCSIRKNLGTDIYGACGQLATNPKPWPALQAGHPVFQTALA